MLVISLSTILDINYVDFLQFQRYFIPQAELDDAFIYIIRKPIKFSIDFSYRLKTLRSDGQWLETSKSGNWHVRGKAPFGHISQMSTN